MKVSRFNSSNVMALFILLAFIWLAACVLLPIPGWLGVLVYLTLFIGCGYMLSRCD